MISSTIATQLGRKSSNPISNFLQHKCTCCKSIGPNGSCTECAKKKLVGMSLQTKLRINESTDAYEKEADRVAEYVMRMPEAISKTGERQSRSMVQRHFAGDVGQGAILQRAAAVGTAPESEGVKFDDTAPAKDEGSRCPSWRQDPQSISKRAAETYVQNDMTPPSQATVEKIDCEAPNSLGNYRCFVHFSDKLTIEVIVRAKDVVVGVPPFTTMTPPPATPLCFYDYTCPDQDLVLTKRECKSAKPPATAGPPPLVGQRRAAAGAAGAFQAEPIVHEVLASPGQPLDAATRKFFGARFGHDFADVRVHADAKAAESARSVSAFAYTVGSHVVFAGGQFSPGTHTGQQLLAHELVHVLQQTGRLTGAAPSAAEHHHPTPVVIASMVGQANGAQAGMIQCQPKSEGRPFRDLPIFLGRLELDIGKNLQDYGHHLYQAATLHPDEPDVLQNALTRYALGLNVLKDSYRFAGFEPDTADKLAFGTGILFKDLTFLREGEFVFDFQVDIGRGVKFETNLNLEVNPRNVTDVRKAGVNFGLVKRF